MRGSNSFAAGAIAARIEARHDRSVIAMFLLAVSAPPVPPPPAPAHEAAIALWAETVGEQQRQQAITLAVYAATFQALEQAGLRFGEKRWNAVEKGMRERIAGHVPEDRAAIDRQAFGCASDPVARSLSVEQIGEARRFFATPAGRLFWLLTEPHAERLRTCYQEALKLEARAEDYRVLGLKVPNRVRNRTTVRVIDP